MPCLGVDSEPPHLAKLPSPEKFPSPWVVWTLFALVRHRRRQLWVGEIVATRLDGNLGQLARRGATAHPESHPQRGVVLGLADWEYFFHGRGSGLTHRATGDAIDVDFFDENAEHFDPFSLAFKFFRPWRR